MDRSRNLPGGMSPAAPAAPQPPSSSHVFEVPPPLALPPPLLPQFVVPAAPAVSAGVPVVPDAPAVSAGVTSQTAHGSRYSQLMVTYAGVEGRPGCEFAEGCERGGHVSAWWVGAGVWDGQLGERFHGHVCGASCLRIVGKGRDVERLEVLLDTCVASDNGLWRTHILTATAHLTAPLDRASGPPMHALTVCAVFTESVLDPAPTISAPRTSSPGSAGAFLATGSHTKQAVEALAAPAAQGAAMPQLIVGSMSCMEWEFGAALGDELGTRVHVAGTTGHDTMWLVGPTQSCTGPAAHDGPASSWCGADPGALPAARIRKWSIWCLEPQWLVIYLGKPRPGQGSQRQATMRARTADWRTEARERSRSAQ